MSYLMTMGTNLETSLKIIHYQKREESSLLLMECQ